MLFIDVARAADSIADPVQRAETLLPANARRLVLNEAPKVHWAEDGGSLWYRRETPSGQDYIRVKLPDGNRSPLFDHSRLARALSKAADREIDQNSLALAEDSVNQLNQTLQTTVGGARFGCSWSTYECRTADPDATRQSASSSPDERFQLIRDGYNLYLEDRVNERSTSLTLDGSPDRYYGADVFLERDMALGLNQTPPVVWSPDSRWAATIRLTVTGVGRTSILSTETTEENPRPRAVSFRYPMLGDETLPMAELVLVDTAAAEAHEIASEAWPVSSSAPFSESSNTSLGWWSADGSTFSWLQIGRGNHSMSLWTVDTTVREARKVLTEDSQTRVGPQQGFIDPRNTLTLKETGEVIWFSERDGWGHLYLYDGRTGALKRRLTRGPWLVREVIHVDSKQRFVYFSAGGRESDRNPYHRHLYRASLDGGRPELLTTENADHKVEVSPCGRYFVDTFSRIDTAPRTVIRNTQGEIVADLETADLTALMKAGWQFPEPFTALAADGETPIYGALFYPRDYSATKKYALIDDIYPLSRTPSHFRLDAAQALADLGFVVVTLDARGSTGRSKAFHDAGYGLMAGRLEDHVAALRSLGEDRSELDLERVGIIGHSWGGAAAARAILLHPDFFDVAVASSGTHDMRIAQGWFAESVVGLSDAKSGEATNLDLAERLTGKLLLAHGGADYWTHPAHTMRLAQSLLAEGKDFDLIVLPETRHNVPSSPNFRRRAWDYFLRHLGPPRPR